MKGLELISATTVNQAIESKNPVIGIISKANKDSARVVLTFLITDVIAYLSVGNSMNDNQLAQTVELILGDVNFKNLKPDDFKVCFDNAKKGFYGKSYNRIDGMIICEWLSLYASERADICESMAIQKAAEDKKKGNLIAPEVVELYQKIYDENNGFKEIEKIKEVPAQKVIQKSPRDIFIQKCLTDFSEKSFNERFMEFEGRQIDQVEYCQIKLKEYDNATKGTDNP